MTKVKKLLSMFMVCIFVLCAVQPIAFAGLFDRKISDVEISINNAISGYFADEYEQYIEIKSKGVIFDNTGAKSFEVLDGTYNMDGKPMISGKTYTFRMRLVADKGYKFKGDSIKNLNVLGGRITDYGVKHSSDSETYYLEIFCNVKIEDAKTVPVTQLNIELNSKIAGVTAAYKEVLSKINTEGVRLSSVICSEDDFSKVIYYSKYDGKFEMDKTYYFRFYYTTNGGYNSDNLEKVIVNGEEYSNWRISSSLEPGSKKQIMVEVPIMVDGINGKTIEEISFNFDKKLVDSEIHMRDIADFVTTDTKNIEITKVSVKCIYPENSSDAFLLKPESQFSAEQIYRLTIFVKADEGYSFNGVKKAVINGENFRESDELHSNTGYSLSLTYDFTPEKAELTFFEQIIRFFRNLFHQWF